VKRLKAIELVLDFDLYPRNNVDSHNVRGIIDAMEAGITLPPVVICKRTKRVADGFHRVRAVLQRDQEGEVDVVEKVYKTDAEFFLDAMRYNAHHGARLDPCDRTRCTIIAERLSIPLDQVAGALHMPTDKLGELKVARTATSTSGLSVPLKRTIQHMAGHRLTKSQVEANSGLSGMNQQFYANQLISLIENGLLDKEDEKLFERLAKLRELLDEVLAVA
jgi:hypothetical protein